MRRADVLRSHLIGAVPGGSAPAAGLLDGGKPPVGLAEGARMGGMRVTVIPGVTDGIWNAWPSIQQVLHVKKIPVTQIAHPLGPEFGGPEGGQDELYKLTAQRSLPVLFWEQERPRSAWLEQVTLAERVGSGPKLIPEDDAQRVQVIGMLNEVLGEDGFCFHKRILSFTTNDAFLNKYGNNKDHARSAARCVEVVRMLDEMMRAQEARGSRFLVGNGLTALDIVWACSTAMLTDPGADIIKRKEGELSANALAAFEGSTTPEIRAVFTPRLAQHRDYILRTYCDMPGRAK